MSVGKPAESEGRLVNLRSASQEPVGVFLVSPL